MFGEMSVKENFQEGWKADWDVDFLWVILQDALQCLEMALLDERIKHHVVQDTLQCLEREIMSLLIERIEHPCRGWGPRSEHAFQYVEQLRRLHHLTVSLSKKSQVDSDVYVRCRKLSWSKPHNLYSESRESYKQKKKETRVTDFGALKIATQKFENYAIMESLLLWDEPERVIYNPVRCEIGGKQRPWLQSWASPQDDGEKLLESASPIPLESQRANYENKMVKIEEMLLRAGALRARDLPKQDGVHGWVSGSGWDWDWRKRSSNAHVMNAIVSPRRESASCALLLMATMFAAVTYRAAFTPPVGTLQTQVYAYKYGENGNLRLGKQDSTITHSFIFFNSTVFFGSLSIMILLLHDFPLKPWPQITVSTLIGSYMCAIVATSPTLALALFFLATPFLVFPAAAKLLGFSRSMSYHSS